MCSSSAMNQRRRLMAVCTSLLSAALAGGCVAPVSDPDKLRAIRDEAHMLATHHSLRLPNDSADVPANAWPPTIASLKPHSVTVYSWGVDISVKPYFDGGWGYHVAHSEQRLPMPIGCYSELLQNVFWHGPC